MFQFFLIESHLGLRFYVHKEPLKCTMIVDLTGTFCDTLETLDDTFRVDFIIGVSQA